MRNADVYWATSERQGFYAQMHHVIRRLRVPLAAEELGKLGELLRGCRKGKGLTTLLTRTSQVR